MAMEIRGGMGVLDSVGVFMGSARAFALRAASVVWMEWRGRPQIGPSRFKGERKCALMRAAGRLCGPLSQRERETGSPQEELSVTVSARAG